MVRMLLLSSGHVRAVLFSGRLVGHHAAQLYPAQASGTWRKDRSLCGKEQGTWPCVTLSPLLPPPASEQGLRVPFGTPVLICRPLPGTGPLGFSPRSAPHVHADSAAAFTSGTRSLPQPCSERGGGSRVQCLAPVRGEEGRGGGIMQAPFRICVVSSSYTSSCLFEAHSHHGGFCWLWPRKGGGFSCGKVTAPLEGCEKQHAR